ncbi:hypothetical protein L2E82_29905 [Cichorium intybus]|uniref:Uncharacterized protein n=1 Tax=Cichorium intybus TaxID=13427 RepID=A0ACB9CYW6_CICIN|nr:hypothetical protein L2E82_29905 [Cichorium intybus]
MRGLAVPISASVALLLRSTVKEFLPFAVPIVMRGLAARLSSVFLTDEYWIPENVVGWVYLDRMWWRR